MEVVKIMVDNQSVIMLSKTSANHNRTKHIDTRYHFIRDCVEDARAVIEHVKTEDQLADKIIGESEVCGAKCKNWSEEDMRHKETQGGECER